MQLSVRLLSLALASALAMPAVQAKELTGSLKKIKDSGEIILGYRDASIPFSYIVSGTVPMGYSHDLQLKVVEQVKKQLKMPNLRVRYNLVTSQTRIPLLQNGTVDLECGSTTNNLERQKQVDFSLGIFEIGTRLMTAKNSGVKDFADLKGKNVVTTAGTTSERLLKSMNADKQMGMNIITAKDHAESFLILESGRAVAFMMDDALLYGEMAKAKNPGNWVVTGKPQTHEIYACMIRKGDNDFKKLVDGAIRNTYKSGQVNKIYSKWFMSPVPPKGLNLRFPMSEENKALFAHPTDKAAE